MNNYSNKKYSTLAKYILLIITITLLMIVVVWKFDTFWAMTQKVINVLMPVIWGLVLAFLMNPIMKQLERFLYHFIFKQRKRKDCQGDFTFANLYSFSNSCSRTFIHSNS